MHLPHLLLGALGAAVVARGSSAPIVSTYVPNWSEYRPSPYTFSPSNMAPIVPKLDEVIYAFIYFCPPPGTSPMPYWAVPPYGSCDDSTAYQLLSVDPHDQAFLSTLTQYKSTNPTMKVTISIGGWDFPSAYFSALAADATARETFAESVASWVSQYNLDGVDIDWEYPCSPARAAPVEITCTDFQTVQDDGGNCPQDAGNFVLLMQALRQKLGNSSIVSVASQADHSKDSHERIAQVAPYVDWFHIMSYDYTVSDVTTPGVMSPNAPLFTPPAPALQESMNDTIWDYIGQGVPREKLLVGLPLYGHTWYNTGLGSGDAWAKFGNTAQMQGKCCGPFQPTYGAQPGLGALQCGLYMYSEIQASSPDKYVYDNKTQSAIAYFTQTGADGYTAPGTWVTYNDETSAAAVGRWARETGLGGVFMFDASMDTVQGGQFTFQFMSTVAKSLGK